MRFAILAAALTLAACQEQKAPARAPAASTRPLTSTTVHRATPVVPEDAGTAAPAPDAGEAALGESLDTFTGFSRDESQFAWAVYSDGAGAFILQLVDVRSGELAQRFVLDTPESQAQARAELTAGGFSLAQGALPHGTTVDAKVEKGKVTVTEKLTGAAPKVLYSGDPFAGHGGPAAAKQVRVSPSGKKVAVKVEQKPVTEFGGTTTWLVLDLEPAK